MVCGKLIFKWKIFRFPRRRSTSELFPTGIPCPIYHTISAETWAIQACRSRALTRPRLPAKRLSCAESIEKRECWGTERRGRTGSSRRRFATLPVKPTRSPDPESRADSPKEPKRKPILNPTMTLLRPQLSWPILHTASYLRFDLYRRKRKVAVIFYHPDLVPLSPLYSILATGRVVRCRFSRNNLFCYPTVKYFVGEENFQPSDSEMHGRWWDCCRYVAGDFSLADWKARLLFLPRAL